MTMKVILFCGSAGAIDELNSFVSEIPKGFEAVVVVLLHRTNSIEDQMVKILNGKSKIPVHGIEHFMTMQKGTIYVIPGSYHCLLNSQLSFELDYSEKEMYCRPCADISLESFSHVLQEKLTAVIVSGGNRDGSLGIQYVLKRKGKVIIQNPEKAICRVMPFAALEFVNINDVIVYDDSLYTTINKALYGKG